MLRNKILERTLMRYLKMQESGQMQSIKINPSVILFLTFYW